ncbi:MAG: amidase [Rhodospirillales bacterium]|nr:amidase [Rhodospirillales bacterium]
MQANLLNAVDAAEAIRDGSLTSTELVEACLARIEQVDGNIEAWAHLDPAYALQQAGVADEYRQMGGPLGPLHGVPVAIKDIIDTADMPTENGTVLYSGRCPSTDATLVSLLREAGAVILGKAVTTEMAVFSPGKTRNPHNPEHTPGGSSSGSAAAVAAGMVPLSVGTQTNGSMIRPASFCGVFGFKPSHGRISRTGVLAQSPMLETPGVYGRSLEDLALIAEVLMAYDAADPVMKPQARPHILSVMAEEPPVDPHLAFVRSPVWDEADVVSKDAFRELIDHLNENGEHVDIVDLPTAFDEAHETLRVVMEADLAKNFAKEYRDGKDKLSTVLCDMIERGQQVLATDYNAAVERAADLNAMLDMICEEYDAIVTPSAIGEAPKGLESTGSPTFCTIWTLCGTPALNLPVMQGENGLPIGAQLVSQKGDDARLFRTARWMLKKLEE